jgi:hypothetical protein
MTEVSQPIRKRPKLVWVAFLFYLFSAGYTLLSFLLIYSGTITVTPDQAAYFRNLSVIDHGFTVLIGSLHLFGAVTLFMLRRVAFYLFTAALALSLVLTVIHSLTKGFIAALGEGGAVGVLLGYGIAVVICVYAWKLRTRGVLA